MIFTLFGYPGWHIIFGIHWNLYTAPNFLAFCMSIVGIILIIFWFDGKMHIKKHDSAEPTLTEISLEDLMDLSQKQVLSSNVLKNHNDLGYDVTAVIVMIVMKIASELNMQGIIA